MSFDSNVRLEIGCFIFSRLFYFWSEYSMFKECRELIGGYALVDYEKVYRDEVGFIVFKYFYSFVVD